MSPPPRTDRRANALARWAPAVVLFAGLLAYSAVQAPVPAVNEPQYLGKAKHFWDPSWCPGDFFLDSSNPHLVFYAAVGWLTRFLSLEVTAWVARAAGYALLAAGWTMLARHVAGSRWAALPSAALFLLLASLGSLRGNENPALDALSSFGSLSGEWLVGGIEGKVFAYGLLFAAIASRIDGRLTPATACLGAATSFHPIVGAWGLVCGAAVELLLLRLRGGAAALKLRDLLVPAVVFLLTALPGLIPAALTLGGDPRAAARATYMQVFVRLRHHLDPTEFPPERYLGYAILVATACLFAVSPRRRGGWHALKGRGREVLGEPTTPLQGVPPEAWFATFVFATVLVAAAGVAVGWHSGDAWTMPLRDLRGTLLKFYPFRLADVFVPLAFSIAVARLMSGNRCPTALSPDPPPPPIPRLLLPSLFTPVAFTLALAIPSPDRNPSRMSPERLADWRDVARWVREHTAPDALILSPSRQWGFRWFAGRPVYVDYKDAPQDAPGLLEWERRLAVRREWWESEPTGQYSAADLRRLGDLTDGDLLVTDAYPGRFTPKPLYDNGTYRVYSLHP